MLPTSFVAACAANNNILADAPLLPSGAVALLGLFLWVYIDLCSPAVSGVWECQSADGLTYSADGWALFITGRQASSGAACVISTFMTLTKDSLLPCRI